MIASSDLRNVIATINGLTSSFTNTCNVTINDKDDLVTARNVICLLVAILEDSDEAVPLILHLWYSSRLPPSLLSILGRKIIPEIARVVNDCVDADAESVISESWSSHATSVTVNLAR